MLCSAVIVWLYDLRHFVWWVSCASHVFGRRSIACKDTRQVAPSTSYSVVRGERMMQTCHKESVSAKGEFMACCFWGMVGLVVRQLAWRPRNVKVTAHGYRNALMIAQWGHYRRVVLPWTQLSVLLGLTLHGNDLLASTCMLTFGFLCLTIIVLIDLVQVCCEANMRMPCMYSAWFDQHCTCMWGNWCRFILLLMVQYLLESLYSVMSAIMYFDSGIYQKKASYLPIALYLFTRMSVGVAPVSGHGQENRLTLYSFGRHLICPGFCMM